MICDRIEPQEIANVAGISIKKTPAMTDKVYKEVIAAIRKGNSPVYGGIVAEN